LADLLLLISGREEGCGSRPVAEGMHSPVHCILPAHCMASTPFYRLLPRQEGEYSLSNKGCCRCLTGAASLVQIAVTHKPTVILVVEGVCWCTALARHV